VRFKTHLYYEEKDTVPEASKKEDAILPIHPGSKILGFKNGVCQGTAFENIGIGTYYPTISLYRSTVVRVNFGQEAWIKPVTDIDYRMV
jgi:Set1/Ash2 histone methyltransferase complex subunit ASH2